MGLGACGQRSPHQLRKRSSCILGMLRLWSRQHGRVAILSADMPELIDAVYAAELLLPPSVHDRAGRIYNTSNVGPFLPLDLQLASMRACRLCNRCLCTGSCTP